MRQTDPDARSPASPNAIDWERYLREHSRELRNWVARQFGGDDGVDDVMQEVALATVKASDAPTDSSKALPWLKAVARHKVRDHWRRVARERRLQESVAAESPAHATGGASPYDWVLRADRIEGVRDALAVLNPDERRILVAKYGENHSSKTLAAREGVTPKAFEHRLAKARERLRSRLTKIFNSDTQT